MGVLSLASRIAAAWKQLLEGARRRTLLRKAGVEALRGNGERALELVEQAAASGRPTTRERALLHHTRGVALFDLQRGEESAAQHQLALTIFRELREEESVAQSLVAYGRAARLQEHHKIALACYAEALGLFRTRKQDVDIARVLLAIGNIHLDSEQWIEADLQYRDALEILCRLKDHTGIGITLNARADAARGRSDFGAERALREEALPHLRKSGIARTQAECARALARLDAREGRADEAKRHYEEASDAFRKIGWLDEAAECAKSADPGGWPEKP